MSSVFTFVSNGITVTENGIATTGSASLFRVFAEVDRGNRLQTGVAIANISATAANVQFELLTMDGRPSGFAGSTTISPNGHIAMLLNEIPGLKNLPATFQGVLQISSNTSLSAIGLRTRYNERSDFLISTTPAIADNVSATTQELVFPHVVSGGGYTTEFILMNSAGSSQGTVTLKSQTGSELPLLAPSACGPQELSMQIKIDDLTGPEIAALLREHLENMAQNSPPESMHALSLQELRKPDITFWSAWEETELVGCGALKELDPQHGEIKSMRTASKHLRKGIAAKVLEHI